MKVLLINPSVRPDNPQLMFNVGLVYIASAIARTGAELEILDIDAHRYSDDEVTQRVADTPCDVIAVGTLVSRYAWFKRTAAAIRRTRPKIPIVVGNTLGTSVPHIVCSRTAADICVLGEGDETIVDLLAAIDSGRDLKGVRGICFRNGDGNVVRTEERPVIQEIDQIPFPNYDLFETDLYLPRSHKHVSSIDFIKLPPEKIIAMPVNTARGCPYRCSFCYHAFQEKRYRHRSPRNVCDEVELLQKKYGVVHIDFWDELTFYSCQATEEFLDLMIERNLKVTWLASMRSDLLTHIPREKAREVARKYVRAGAIGAGFSLESGNNDILKAMNKHNTNEDFIQQTGIFREVGLPIYTSIVLGYPQETEETIADTFDVLKRARVYPSVGYLQPMPGTPMYTQAIQMGVIRDEEEYLMKMGDRQDLRVNLTSLSYEHMQAVVKKHLVELNQFLGTGLDEDHLIRTGGTYKADRRTVDTFLHGFGVAAEVVREMEQKSPSPSC